MEPTIKGWCWNIPFYPCGMNGERTIKSIFWYDSSNDLEFTKHTEEYQIVLPEETISATPEQIKYVHDNLERIIQEKELVVRTNDKGKFFLNDIKVKNKEKINELKWRHYNIILSLKYLLKSKKSFFLFFSTIKVSVFNVLIYLSFNAVVQNE